MLILIWFTPILHESLILPPDGEPDSIANAGRTIGHVSSIFRPALRKSSKDSTLNSDKTETAPVVSNIQAALGIGTPEYEFHGVME
jgi:hypothetical protein